MAAETISVKQVQQPFGARWGYQVPVGSNVLPVPPRLARTVIHPHDIIAIWRFGEKIKIVRVAVVFKDQRVGARSVHRLAPGNRMAELAPEPAQEPRVAAITLNA